MPNPDYKGTWKPAMIDNPDYKGEWVHPMVPNPDYTPDVNLHARCEECTHIGFELWQVTAGSSFDNIIVTDSLEEAQQFAEETFFKIQDKEKKMFEDIMEKEREEAAREAEEAAAKAKFEADMDEEEEDHDEL